jgi:hypothetical protein
MNMCRVREADTPACDGVEKNCESLMSIVVQRAQRLAAGENARADMRPDPWLWDNAVEFAVGDPWAVRPDACVV